MVTTHHSAIEIGTCFRRLAIEVVITSKILASSIQFLQYSDFFKSVYIIQPKIAKNRIEITIALQAINDGKNLMDIMPGSGVGT